MRMGARGVSLWQVRVEEGLDFGDWHIVAYHWRGGRGLSMFAADKFSWIT